MSDLKSTSVAAVVGAAFAIVTVQFLGGGHVSAQGDVLKAKEVDIVDQTGTTVIRLFSNPQTNAPVILLENRNAGGQDSSSLVAGGLILENTTTSPAAHTMVRVNTGGLFTTQEAADKESNVTMAWQAGVEPKIGLTFKSSAQPARILGFSPSLLEMNDGGNALADLTASKLEIKSATRVVTFPSPPQQ